ncbi:tRNA (adenosine(37)-N6)-threonylcarbamoyltransferase complex ATPase subunit type 1 TsaE [Qipengyuania sp. JC766]|uniref:tRNA (adenosine(37)-N6)-threonylcarbamoyltransferase complex ATPase subunit type 1 TsaE n=1 Tax=Qipengyuania sp. JC766 TaxID=3232139 RepID=UPI00345821D9
MTIALPDIAATEALGRRIADLLEPGDIVALSGGLGAGKTTLARAILSALGHRGEVPSPTFTIVQTYDPPSVRLPVVHADFYRLNSADELEELGIDEYREGAAMLAEWPEQVGGFSHDPRCLSIALETADAGRMAIARPGADWLSRWR